MRNVVLIIFVTSQPEHPTKQQIIGTLDNSRIPFEVVDPSISWRKLNKKLKHTSNPFCLFAPDHQHIFCLCAHLKRKNYPVINSCKITLLCRHRISISLRIQNLIKSYKKDKPNIPIHIPNPRFYRNPSQLQNNLRSSDFPIVIKYPVNHTGVHYVDIIPDNEIDKIPRFFKKCGVYIEKYIEAQDILLKCYNFGDIVITQQESNRQSLYQAHNANPDTYKSRKYRDTVQTPPEIEAFTHYIAEELGITIFGMDFLITEDDNYWLVDFNDFPGARGVENAGEIIANILIRKMVTYN